MSSFMQSKAMTHKERLAAEEQELQTEREKHNAETQEQAEKAADEAENATLSSEELTFKKRYGDTKNSYNALKAQFDAQQEQIKNLKKDVMEAQKASAPMPSTEEELKEYAESYPQMYNIIMTLAQKQSDSRVAALESEIQDLKTANQDVSRDAFMRSVIARVPNALELHSDPDFADWLAVNSTPNAILNNNAATVEEVVGVLEFYNDLVGMQTSTKKQKKSAPANAASAPPNGSGTAPDADEGGYLFKESQISQMSQRAYEAKSSEIMDAYREGKVLLDLSN